MKKTIAGKEFVFKDKLNFYTQLKLTDLDWEQEKGEIKQSEFLLGLIGIFLESIDWEKNAKKNIDFVKSLDEQEDIELLTDCIEKSATAISSRSWKKKGK